MDKHLQACSPEFFDRPFFTVHGYDETMSEVLHGLEGEETNTMVCETGVRSMPSQDVSASITEFCSATVAGSRPWSRLRGRRPRPNDTSLTPWS